MDFKAGSLTVVSKVQGAAPHDGEEAVEEGEGELGRGVDGGLRAERGAWRDSNSLIQQPAKGGCWAAIRWTEGVLGLILCKRSLGATLPVSSEQCAVSIGYWAASSEQWVVGSEQ